MLQKINNIDVEFNINNKTIDIYKEQGNIHITWHEQDIHIILDLCNVALGISTAILNTDQGDVAYENRTEYLSNNIAVTAYIASHSMTISDASTVVKLGVASLVTVLNEANINELKKTCYLVLHGIDNVPIILGVIQIQCVANTLSTRDDTIRVVVRKVDGLAWIASWYKEQLLLVSDLCSHVIAGIGKEKSANINSLILTACPNAGCLVIDKADADNKHIASLNMNHVLDLARVCEAVLSTTVPSINATIDSKLIINDGIKFDDDKPQWHLLPSTPLKEAVDVLTFGAKKYAPDNWRKVNNAHNRYYDAMMRHIVAYRDGSTVDSETNIHHLAHVIVNAMFLRELEAGPNDNYN